MQPAVQEGVKAVVARFTAEELITKRPAVKAGITDILTERLQKRSIIVEEVSKTDFEFSQTFNDAIESKVKAEQEALQALNELERIKIEKEQTITRAEATAQAIKETADAEAYALQVVREQLEKNKELIDYLTIEKWDGVLPKYTGGGAVPFINIDTPQEE